ncbi:DNA polymerase epsilon catalytic subunit [Tulasnella sp. JGI-2019a]|nr:DNA polymerase epsilon catalytic subunit [Tulasnella sp. JGI-2019a]
MARGNPRGTFGLVSNRARGRGGSSGQWRGRGGRGRGSFPSRGRGGTAGGDQSRSELTLERADDGKQVEDRFEDVKLRDEIDEKLGFARYTAGPSRDGWLVNMHPTLVKDEESPLGRSGVDYYFIQDDGGMFKATMLYEPYFYISCKMGTENVVDEWLMKKYEGVLHSVSRVKKEDLDMPNHLLGYRRIYLRLNFRNVSDLLTVRKDMLPLALKNSREMNAVDAYAEVINATSNMQVSIELEDAWGAEAESSTRKGKSTDPRDLITDIREYDVPYYLRVAIDNGIRVGLWYTVTSTEGVIRMDLIKERVKRAEPVVMAYDIEVTKLPLKFPDQALDQIMMISYMIDGQGFLITNRDIVSEDIEDFEYTPKPEYEGPFTIFNEPDEEAVIRRWFEHIREAKPTVIATYNGDAFDFPFVEARAIVHGIDMFEEIGFKRDNEDEFKSRSCIHMDCFRWVKRDSYLPQGSQGLKAVTTYKLGYNPTELDPELMTPYAYDHPQLLAQYSVSDAVATYYLYMKYVHPFVFSLCNIIPLNPDEVLRKGSGTLCETLLMVEAYRSTVIMPNRHEDPHGNMFEGHLLASETYVGGHVEALEAGVFRSDIPTNFKVTPSAVQQLIDDLDAALKFCIRDESKMELSNITNYDEVKSKIKAALEELRDTPTRFDEPLIYHLDVAAMYPNIMLSNRLQPDSVVDEATCAVCDYNRPGKTCDRRMTWAWRGEYFPAQRDEYNMVKHALQQESFPGRRPTDAKKRFDDLTDVERTALVQKRLGDYSRKVYKKTKETKVVQREAIICQRENPFYIDTVRSFRDRRYEYKGLHKTWKKNLDTANDGGSVAEIAEAKSMIVLYDSLQLAHKCILNSFYGYVMRKGARWYSMEMAGITCLTGATIIQMARQLVEQIGRPLELDTDGIWCMLPGTFPENFTFTVAKGKPLAFSYPCTMLNHLVHARFTNDQYHTLVDPESGKWGVHSENSIFFELDGPYKAMILPSSKEEDKLLKKRYAVFNDDGSLAELKGFEVKRRGELQLIKIFQSQIFENFLLGTTTEECYAAVAVVADRWLDVLFSKASTLEDEELVELIAENRSMSKTLAEYGSQKSTSISTARRLAEFLGDQMVKDKGLACRFVISEKPIGAPVTERAVPVAIFSAEEGVKRKYLRKWLKDNSLAVFDLRSILDWNYYIERLGSVIQKIITIPAAMQKVANPVPRIRHPDWLHKRVAALDDKFRQHKMTDFFGKRDISDAQDPPRTAMGDIEDVHQDRATVPRPKIGKVNRKAKTKGVEAKQPDEFLPIPDPGVEWSGWIEAMKDRWRAKQSQRYGTTVSNLIPAMFRGAKIKTVSSWDVAQFRATNVPGRFVMWTYTDSTFVPIAVRVPREFYLNLKVEAGDDTFQSGYTAESVVRTLPRGHTPQHLYHVVVPEPMYLRSESHFADLMNHPNVDGSYELHVPLITRALLRVGTRATVDYNSDNTFTRAKDSGFDLRELERAGTSLTKRTYLNGGSSIKYMLLFHAATAPRHVFALFQPGGALKIHVVDPATRRQPLVKIQELYTTLRQQAQQEYPVVTYPENITPDIAYHGSEAIALKAISRELGLLEKDNPSTMLIVSSTKEQSWFEEMTPRVDRFPMIMWLGNKAKHSLDGFTWQVEVVRLMLSRYLGMSQWLYRMMYEAELYDVPIGNIETDESLFYTDIDFARRLLKKDMVLWWSSSGKPDLGGREEDTYALDELVNPEYNVPGCYSNVCLSLEVKNLALNAVAQSAIVNEMEGSGGTTAFDSTSHTLDEYVKGDARAEATLGDAAVSPQAFAVLKDMVKSWLEQKDKHHTIHLGVNHFWRWLSSGAAALFDPGLHRFVHGLMRKTFLQMLAEFRRLGSNVISADFGRILLLTSKPPGTAAAYATYLVSAITSHELFKTVELNADRYWDFLLFMDGANYGGVICQDPYAVEPPPGMTIANEWNIAAFLPQGVQPYFRSSVKKFLLELYKIKMRHTNSSKTPMRVNHSLTQGGSDPQPQDAEKLQENAAIETFISKNLTRIVLSSLQEVIEKERIAKTHGTYDDFVFPLLPGSHFHMDSPPLEFVKFTCAVFALAKDFVNDIGVLKKNLLSHISVREFSDEAVFRNPCEPFKLRMVICRVCNAMRDFDFCRDPDLLREPGDYTSMVRWQCPSCECDYDRRAIEATLIDVVRRLVTTYQMQDMKCAKCKQIKSDNLSMHCNCSGSYVLTLPKAEIKRKLRTIVNVAKYHILPLLKDYSEYTLDNW